jgi:ACS family tartrate transporter-like MFS transporter
VATIGFYGMKTSFWPLPSNFLSGTAAAAAIAAINSLGNFGGVIGPNLVGWLKDSTGSFEAGLYAMAGCADLGDCDSHCGSSTAQAGRAHGSGRGGGVTSRVR